MMWQQYSPLIMGKLWSTWAQTNGRAQRKTSNASPQVYVKASNICTRMTSLIAISKLTTFSSRTRKATLWLLTLDLPMLTSFVVVLHHTWHQSRSKEREENWREENGGSSTAGIRDCLTRGPSVALLRNVSRALLFLMLPRALSTCSWEKMLVHAWPFIRRLTIIGWQSNHHDRTK